MPPASIAIHAGSLPGVVTVDESAYRLSEERVDAYLHRLGLSRADVASAPSLGALTALQTAHVDRIAYETIGVHTGEPPPPLDPRSSVERVVVHERGGYCFLLVDAYAALLVSLGFSVSLHCGGVGPYPLPLERWGNHVVLLVHGLGDGPLVSDVGLGDGPAAPFALRTHEWSEGGYTYALREEAARAGEWRFVHDSGASFEGFSFRVDTSCTGAREFGRYHEWYWGSAGSPYRSAGLVLQRMRSDERGVLEMRNGTLAHVLPGGGGKVALAVATSTHEWRMLVALHFFLPLHALEHDALWAVACAATRQQDAACQRESWRWRRHALVLAAAVAAVAILAKR